MNVNIKAINICAFYVLFLFKIDIPCYCRKKKYMQDGVDKKSAVLTQPSIFCETDLTFEKKVKKVYIALIV